MTRETKMWQAVEQEYGKISLREALMEEFSPEVYKDQFVKCLTEK